jgi:curved DNA-binding protein CbpA
LTLSPVSIGDVFLDAAFHLADIGLYRGKLLLDEYVLAQTRDALALAGNMKLSDEEAQVLDLVDERNSVGQIVASSPLSQDRTLRLLLALRQAGIVALKPPEEKKRKSAPPPAASSVVDPMERELTTVFNDMQCQNHWQVLGLGREASFEEIERAFQSLYRKFDPAQLERLPASDCQEKLSWVRARLREAFVTLSSKTSTNLYDRMVDREKQYEETRESWKSIPTGESEAASAATPPESRDRSRSAEEAKALFTQAKRAYKEQDFWRAIELCRASIELSEENDPERFHLLGKALAENPRWRQDAEQNLKIAQNLKPWEPRYLVSLAKFYEKVGLQRRAQRLYEQVRVMVPDYRIGDEVEGQRSKSDPAAEDVLDERAV